MIIAGSDEDLRQPLPRLRLYEELERKLKGYIRENRLQPGDRLPTERALAESLGVSRNSVKQAIIVLEVEGLVEVRHGDGMYLRDPDGRNQSLRELLERRRRLPDVLDAREALECKLAELAAKNRTEDDLIGIDQALARMGQEIADGNIGLSGDAEFHLAVARAAHNAVLLQLIDVLSEAILETRIESLRQPGRPPQSLAGHQRIADAIHAQQPRAAVSAMRKHLQMVASVRLLRWEP